jgi:glucokinase
MSTGHPETGTARLVADIGGTHARFALADAGSSDLRDVIELQTRDYPDLAAAVTDYLSKAAGGKSAQPTEAAIAIANPVTGDAIKMTNGRWAFSTEDTRKKLNLSRLLIINDFEALALAVPALPPDTLRKVGGGATVKTAPIALIGPGTGLGISSLIPDGGHGKPLPGEGGHITAPASNEREAAIIAVLRREFTRVSAERLLCGPGLVNIYRALAAIDGKPAADLQAQDVTQRGRVDSKDGGSDPLCQEALDIFCAMLGTIAGDIALLLGARGGVYIGGGIVPLLGDYFVNSRFRARFEDKGRMSPLNQSIPTWVIDAPHAALTGSLIALS